jgi:hypothetical protein
VKEYFELIIRKLTIDEMAVLGILLDKDATAAFKSIKRNDLFQLSQLSIANFRKTMEKRAFNGSGYGFRNRLERMDNG